MAQETQDSYASLPLEYHARVHERFRQGSSTDGSRTERRRGRERTRSSALDHEVHLEHYMRQVQLSKFH